MEVFSSLEVLVLAQRFAVEGTGVQVQQTGGLGPIAAGGLQCVLNQVLLEPGHGVAERHAGDRARRLGGLQ